MMYRNRIGLTRPYDALSKALCLLWLVNVSYNELWTFSQHVRRCGWPDEALELQRSDSTAQDGLVGYTHMLLLADPQILDAHSYPGRHPWLVWLSQKIVDLNMRKSWRAAQALHPDAVVFLGDMMDNGRMDYTADEYEDYYQRFRHIFRLSQPVPIYYIPGNHDVGLKGRPLGVSPDATERYVSHFGPLNQLVEFGNHTFVLIDAPGLVTEEAMRSRSGYTYPHWVDMNPNGVIAFIHSLAPHASSNPRVLFTHIPLARPDGASCGPLREHGSIRQGDGAGYQNTLTPHMTEFVLQHVRPSLVFSGDDHDYCEYTHKFGSSDADDTPNAGTVKEVTVKSISMAMGIRQPGFQLLSIGVPPTRFATSLATVPCLLPDQLGIYLNVYVPLLIFSLLLLLVSNLHRVATQGQYVGWVALPGWCQCLRVPRWVVFGRRITLRLPLSEQPYEADDVEMGNGGDFETSVPRRSQNAKRVRGLLRGFVRDIFDVAWMPLLLFVVLAWWVQ